MQIKKTFVRWGKQFGKRIWYGDSEVKNVLIDRVSIGEVAKQVKGAFAIIEETDDDIILVCDCIRSYPIFYYVSETEIVISDSAELIADECNLCLDENNVAELLRASYVTGHETIFRHVFQVCAGEYVTISKAYGTVEIGEYYDYQRNPLIGEEYIKQDSCTEEYVEQLDLCLKGVFSDLIDRLNGRTALIPLSGGCDSRTVAVMLKRMRYENVICFSYGIENNQESNMSKLIAKKLGFPWYYVEYNKEKWRKLFASEKYKEFLSYACRGTSVGCVQALPAMLELHEKGIITKEAVVVPGHAMDFLGGSRFPIIEGDVEYDKGKLTKRILGIHYTLRKDKNVDVAIKKWTQYLPDVMKSEEYAHNYQFWEWKNRQSKFTANDVRTYEMTGNEWEMPLWDRRLIDYWTSVPAELLFNRRLQYLYTRKKIDDFIGMKGSYYGLEDKEQGKDIKRYVKKMVPNGIKNVLKNNMISRIIQHRKNGNAFYTWLPMSKYFYYIVKYGSRFNVNTVVSEDYIVNIKKNVKWYDDK